MTAATYPVNIKLQPTASGLYERLNYKTSDPVGVTFTAEPPTSGTSPFTFLWNFGDGTNSTSLYTTHVFPTNCLYNIRLDVTDGGGHVTWGMVRFFVFSSNSTAGTMVVCPQRGTAGITSVQLAGTWYGSSGQLPILLNGRSSAVATKDTKGSWALDVTNDFQPEVNGSVYHITTSPVSVARSFLTLEGIRASPASGEPGDSFTLEGRSYPADIAVSISLGGVPLGVAQTDGQGSFDANLTVPYSFHYAGVYQFTTSPRVLGASATFTIPVSTKTPAKSGFNLWWLVLLAAIAAAAVLAGLYLWLRRRRQAGGEGEREPEEAGSRRRSRRQVSLPGPTRSTGDHPGPSLRR